MRTFLMISAFLAIAGCAAQRVNVPAETRTRAMHLYVDGASARQVATELALEPGVARAVIRAELRRLRHRFYEDQ